MATMYVGGGLYLPTTGTASKPKTTSTPTGGTVTVAQRNAIASTTKPAATTVAKKPTTNTLSTMAGSSLGTTSTKKPTTVASPASTSSMGASRSVTRSGNTAAQNAAVASLLSGAGTRSPTTNPLSTMAGRTLGINAALPQPPQLTKAQIGNRFTQSLAAGAKTGAAVPNPAGLTRDEADTFRSRFYKDFYSGKPVQRIVDSPVFQPGMMGRGQPVPSYDYLFGARNDDSPYVSAYDVARYGSMNSGPGLLPSKEFGGYPGARPEAKLASTLLAGGAGALDAVVSPAYGLGTGLLDYLSGGTPDDFMNSYAGGYGDANAIFQPFETLDPPMYGKGANAGLVAATAYGMPGVMGPTRAAAEAAAAAALARRAPRAVAGIDAAPLTPRQAQFRELMDNLNAGEQAAVPPPVSVGPRIPQGGISPTPAAVSPAEIARLENILGNLGYSAPRTAAAGTRLPGAANMLDEGFVSRAAAANDDRLLANMMRENDARALTSAIDENDARVLRNATRENDTLNALNTAREVRPARGGELFPDINPAATVSDPMDVLRPVFMSADEAADVIRPGPRVATDAGMDPVTKRLLIAAGGAGVAIPGLAGLSLLANGQFAPAPTATTPQPVAVPDGQRGIDAAGAPVSNETLNAFANSRGNMSLRLPGGAGQVSIPTKDGTIILPAPKDAAPAVDPVDSAKVLPVDTSPTGTAVEDAEATFMSTEEKARRDAAINSAEGRVFGSATPLEPGPAGDKADTAAPAAGEKFTPGPGQFVGTNGYIYEQSSDGSFERVGKVPGYTPAQLSEAANKGAFRDPNNIVTGGAKPRKQVKKKGEKNFIDKAGDILKERFDDSLFARLFLNQDDEAAPEAAATGPEAVEYYSTPPSSVPESLVSSSGSSKKRKKKDEDETDGGTGTGGTGTGGTGTGTYTPPTQAMLDALYAPYMRQYTGPGAGYVPGVNPEWRYFTPAFADGGLVDGRLVLGDGGPKEDKIPATIDGVEQAKLSNGEFVMTAAAVKNAGGGDIELGAKRLMDLNNMLSYGRPAERLKVQHVK